MISYEHKFTKSEREEMKSNVVKLLNDEAGVIEEKKAAAAEYKAQLDKINKEIQHAITCINTGMETRTVKCERRVDLENNVVNWMDVESGEVRREELPTAADRQMVADLKSSHLIQIAPDDKFVMAKHDIELDDGDSGLVPKGSILRVIKQGKSGGIGTFMWISLSEGRNEAELNNFECEMDSVKWMQPWDVENALKDAGFTVDVLTDSKA